MTPESRQIQETSAMNAVNFLMAHREGATKTLNRESVKGKARLYTDKLRIERSEHKIASNVCNEKTGWMSKGLLEFCLNEKGYAMCREERA